jgi:UDP-3-O-[3-hydroxymyristoyl] glucosamine N-acyltransferase
LTQSTTKQSGGEGERSLTADAIAELVDGELRGDGATVISGVASLDRATDRDITFLGDRRYAPLFEKSLAGIALISPPLANHQGGPTCRIVVPKPHDSLLKLLPALYPEPEPLSGIHPTVVIGTRTRLGTNVAIGPYTVIGNDARIGDNVRIDSHCRIHDGAVIGAESALFHNVTLYSGARVGRRVRIHAGARIASDGFGYVFQDGEHRKIPHVGHAIIEDDVEIGANTTIDRGSIDDTIIGAGTRIDNLVQIAHNVRIGRMCLIMAQVGVAGSSRVEDGVILAGQAGLSGHLTIGKGAIIAAQAGVFGDVPAGETWSGYPARPHKDALRAQAASFKLPAMMRALEKLARRDDS